ncbi:hypothetical protein BU16DRAFT_96340 [Lophium mytilinum]|uniref:Uncharacterized protein n=1 Tax=Lophium mytilinum TaxID=390894 RepID=A0A6A6QLU5_9PEZI|nr:hypothetical protein BU16DRAFT_96340 [Lophium mytilinum]
MPSFINSRTYSWPPSPTHLSLSSLADAPSKSTGLPDIDDDPFAHFLTPVNEEDDPFDALSLSAGIISTPEPTASKTTKFKSSVAQKWARYVARHHADLHEQYHPTPEEDPDNDDDDEAFIVDLDDARLVDTPRTRDLLSTPAITLSQPTRGRAQELLVPGHRRRRGRASRTLSGHRHSWREPSPELFTVAEVEEAESPVRERKRRIATDDGDRLGIRRSERAKL